MAEQKCKHEIPQYQLCANEAGWKCGNCGKTIPGEPPGFRPDLDRSQIGEKIDAILQTLHVTNLIYISNASQGDCLQAAIKDRCRKNNRYDQYSIILYAIEETAPSHAEFWANITDGILAGKDPRERCWCGKLATQFGSNGGVCSHKHDVDFRGRVKTVRRRRQAGQTDLFEGENKEGKAENDEIILLFSAKAR